MEPVKLEILIQDSTKKGMQSVENGVRKMGRTVEQETADFKARMKEQSDVVKQVESDIRSLEKQLAKAAPGGVKTDLTAELNVARKVLQEEKGELALLEQQVDKTAGKHTMLRTQIAQLKQEMSSMTEGTEEYRAAMERLGTLQDRYGDISTQGRIFSDDNKNIKATMDAISGLAGAMTAGTGVASLFGMEEEKLAKIQTKLQAVMAITIGVQQVANTLNKDSYFTHVLLAKGKTMLTAANTRLAVSLGISTVAAKALMATLTLGLSVAITGLVMLWDRFTEKQNQAKKAQEDATEAARKQAEAESELRKSAASSVSEQLLEYKKLQVAYRELGDDLKKKKKFVNENQKAFDELGIAVANVKDAENLLIDNEAAFLQTMNNRALIAASMEIAAEKYKDAIAKMMEVDAKQKKAENYSIRDLDTDDETVASRIAAEKIHALRGGNFLEGISDEDMEKKLSEYAKTGNKFYTEAFRLFNDEKEKALTEITRQNKDALIRNAEEEKKNVQKFMEEGAESLRNGTKLTKENLDIFKQSGFSPTSANGGIKKDDETKIAEAEIRALKKIEDMKIALMKEGAEREKKQARANFDAELERIDKEETERINALKDAKKRGLKVTPEQVNTVTVQAKSQRDLATQTYIRDYYGIEKKYTDQSNNKLNDLLGKYQDYTAQRLAIETKYNNDIIALQEARSAAARKNDFKQVGEIDRSIAQATKAKGQELMNMDYEQLKQSPEYIRAFENLKNTSSETLNSLLTQLENAKHTAAQVLSPDQLREYTTTIQEIMNELDGRNPFQALSDKKDDLALAEEELANAQASLEKARKQAEDVKNGAKIENGVASSKFNPQTGKIDYTKSYLTEAQALDKVNQKIAEYNKSKDKVVEKSADVKGAEKKVTDQISKLSQSVSELGSAIGGPAGEIISLIGDIGSFTMMAMDGVKAAADTSAESISTVEKASVILAIISAAVQLATKVASLFRNNDREEYEQMKASYESLIEVWDALIERKKEYIAVKTGADAVKAGEEALEILKKQIDAKKELAREVLTVKNGGHSIDSRMWGGSYKYNGQNWKDVAGEIAAHTGKAFNEMKDILNMSAEDLMWIQENYSGFWSKMDVDFRGYLEDLIEYGKKAGDIIDATHESLTQTSFDDVRENFLDTLSDMDASSEDFAKNFESYMQKAILNSMMVNKYKDRLQGWYNKFAEMNGDTAGIDDKEYKKLQEEYDNIVSDALKERNALMEQFGWSGEESSGQTGKSGSFTAMSQEQGTKLEGLFTSVQDHVSGMDEDLSEIVLVMYQAFDTLVRIEQNTAYCKHLEEIADDIAELKRDGFKMR